SFPPPLVSATPFYHGILYVIFENLSSNFLINGQQLATKQASFYWMQPGKGYYNQLLISLSPSLQLYSLRSSAPTFSSGCSASLFLIALKCGQFAWFSSSHSFAK